MTATPQDIAMLISDGQVVAKEDPSILTSFPDASSMQDQAQETMFDTVTEGQPFIDDRFSILSKTNRFHEALEFEDRGDILGGVDVTAALPRIRIVDDSRAINAAMVVRQISFDMEDDKIAFALMGV